MAKRGSRKGIRDGVNPGGRPPVEKVLEDYRSGNVEILYIIERTDGECDYMAETLKIFDAIRDSKREIDGEAAARLEGIENTYRAIMQFCDGLDQIDGRIPKPIVDNANNTGEFYDLLTGDEYESVRTAIGEWAQNKEQVESAAATDLLKKRIDLLKAADAAQKRPEPQAEETEYKPPEGGEPSKPPPKEKPEPPEPEYREPPEPTEPERPRVKLKPEREQPPEPASEKPVEAPTPERTYDKPRKRQFDRGVKKKYEEIQRMLGILEPDGDGYKRIDDSRITGVLMERTEDALSVALAELEGALSSVTIYPNDPRSYEGRHLSYVEAGNLTKYIKAVLEQKRKSDAEYDEGEKLREFRIKNDGVWGSIDFNCPKSIDEAIEQIELALIGTEEAMDPDTRELYADARPEYVEARIRINNVLKPALISLFDAELAGVINPYHRPVAMEAPATRPANPPANAPADAAEPASTDIGDSAPAPISLPDDYSEPPEPTVSDAPGTEIDIISGNGDEDG